VTIEDDIELVRRMLAAFARDDADAVIAEFDDRCEIREPREMPDSPASGFRGHDGVREWIANLRRTGEITFEPIRFEERGRLIVVDLVGRGRGESSGAPIEWPTFAVVELREGKIARLQAFLTRREALEASG
jgi:ketosteroid isomerase-like protein